MQKSIFPQKIQKVCVLQRKACNKFKRNYLETRWTKVVPKVKNARIRRKTVYLCLKTIFKLILMYFQGVKVDFDPDSGKKWVFYFFPLCKKKLLKAGFEPANLVTNKPLLCHYTTEGYLWKVFSNLSTSFCIMMESSKSI